MQEAQEFDFPPLDTPSAQGRANSSAGGMNLRNDTASDTYKPKGRNSGTEFQNRALQDKMTYLVKLKTTETAKGQRRVKSTAPPPHTLFSLGLFFLPSLDPRLLSTCLDQRSQNPLPRAVLPWRLIIFPDLGFPLGYTQADTLCQTTAGLPSLLPLAWLAKSPPDPRAAGKSR